jgi:hypothetical protein
MLTLFATPFQRLHYIRRQDLQSWSLVSAKYHIQVPSEVTQALAGQPRSEEPRLVFDEAGPSAQLMSAPGSGPGISWRATEMMDRATEMMDEVYKWIHVLTLNSVPQVTHLQLTWPLGSLKDMQNPPPTFSQLRELTYDEYYKTEDIIESQALFPNLSSLGAREALTSRLGLVNGPIAVMNIRKLSICCTPKALSTILRLCRHLEDLECHLQRLSSAIKVDEPQWPAHTKSALRRLAWSNEDAIDDVEDNRDPESVCIVPLRGFERLEILEIDQSSLLLYFKLLRAKTLSSLLPKTLRILHIAFARDVLSHLQIARQLRKLANDRATDLPKLSIVKVDDPPRSSKKVTMADFMKRTGVIGVMNDAGVDLRIGQEAHQSYFNRSILSRPPGAGNRRGLFKFQHEVFSLDDS